MNKQQLLQFCDEIGVKPIFGTRPDQIKRAIESELQDWKSFGINTEREEKRLRKLIQS